MKPVKLTRPNGTTYLKSGVKIKDIPSAATLREGLIKLLETVGGNTNDPLVEKFWIERGNAVHQADEFEAMFAVEVHSLLTYEWDRLVNAPPPAEPKVSIFAMFGVSQPEPDLPTTNWEDYVADVEKLYQGKEIKP